MRGLWFKARHVGQILAGTKSDTFRPEHCRLSAGDRVRATVGAAQPFAYLRVKRISRVRAEDLTPSRFDEVQRCLNQPIAGRVLTRVEFELAGVNLDEARRWADLAGIGPAGVAEVAAA